MSVDARTRILIVDDNDDNIELLRLRLEARGYSVHTAHDGQEALEAVAAAPPDLILLDVMMPRVDGFEVVRRLKSDPRLPFIPIILQTALDSTEHKVTGLDAGADDYVTKPVNFAELDARVKSLLRIKALQEELADRERQLRSANAQLLELSRTDPLTGLDNRRHLEERIEELLDLSKRIEQPFSVVLCDLDRFKSVNDTHGHGVGDQVLVEFARLLRREARETDRVGRYGGEEFMVLLPGTSPEAALTFGERARRMVEAHVFRFDGGSLQRTVSCGVAAWPHFRVRTARDLVAAADSALYVAKETGRNRVIRFDSQPYHDHIRPTSTDESTRNDVDVRQRVRHGPGPGNRDRTPGGEGLGAPAGA
jgi:diguanylate cyclase (GGDEF)-like protein